MGHSHHHHHEHRPDGHTPAFAIGVCLNTAFVLIEAAAGFWAGSLALLADAGHNLSDVLGLLLAWGASYLSQQRPSSRRTYGLGRTSIMAALANSLLLLVAVGAIAWEAVGRLWHPTSAAPLPVIIVA